MNMHQVADSGEGFVLDTPDAIEFYRLCAIRGALKLEIAGMRGRYNAGQAARVALQSSTKDKRMLLIELQQVIDRMKAEASRG
jgi:hypothetical protein